MPAAPETAFPRVAVLGTGLIGGSFALAVREHSPPSRVVGWDLEAVLRQAEARGAIHEGTSDLPCALAGADLVYVALPIGLTIELLPEIARRAEPHALVTDACSTKTKICKLAANYFGEVSAAAAASSRTARFLGGHPMTGKECSGIAHADAGLFRGVNYAVIGAAAEKGETDSRVTSFAGLLERFGARPVWLDAETHDWAAAIVSHLPQLLAVTLAEVVRDETDETGLPLTLAGRGLRDALRLAGSPYPMWRDICLTNTDNIARALDRVAQALDHLRTRLASRELEDEFAAANELYKILQDLQ